MPNFQASVRWGRGLCYGLDRDRGPPNRVWGPTEAIDLIRAGIERTRQLALPSFG
jgi:hypothetical protein